MARHLCGNAHYTGRRKKRKFRVDRQVREGEETMGTYKFIERVIMKTVFQDEKGNEVLKRC